MFHRTAEHSGNSPDYAPPDKENAIPDVHLFAFATTEARARTVFGIDESVPMIRQNLALSPQMRAEFGECAVCYAVEARALAIHWLVKNKQAERLIDEVGTESRTVKVYDDTGNAFYIESESLRPGDNLTVAEDQ